MELLASYLAAAAAIIFVLTTLLFNFLLWKSNIARKSRTPPEVKGGWPVIGHLSLLAGPDPAHVTLGKLADKYGPIFTIKLGLHRTLVVSSWEMAKECLTFNDKAFASRTHSLAWEILGYNYSMFAFSPYGSYWRQMRKLVTLELLSNHRLATFKHVREAEVKAAMEGLYQQWSNNTSRSSHKLPVELKKLFWNINLNLILKIIVGKRYAEYTCCSVGEKRGKWRETVNLFSELAGKFVLSDSLPFLRFLDIGGFERAMKKCMKELDEVVQGWLEEHKQNRKVSNASKRQEDFMDVMLSTLDNSQALDPDTITKATCLVLFLAASDTTTITLTWTLSLLLNNRDALRKAQQELDIQVGGERQVQESDIENLVYLQAILKESFRLYPAAPLLVPHESIEDCTVSGYHIPAGTRLLINVAKIHRDSSVWSDPHKFCPERFLTTHKDIDVKGQNLQLIPFGSGRRMCPGISFALQVLNFTLATFLHGFEIETPSGDSVDMSQNCGLSISKATPLDVLLSPRLPHNLYKIS